jgi:hypothetical protein
MPDLERSFRTAAPAHAQTTSASELDTVPGKRSLVGEQLPAGMPSQEAIARVKTYAGETVSDGGGYRYLVLETGAFRITGAPPAQQRAIGRELTPDGAYAKAWSYLARRLLGRPPVAAPAAPHTAAPAEAAATPPAAIERDDGPAFPALTSLVDAIGSTLGRWFGGDGAEPAPANDQSIAPPVAGESGAPALADQCVMDHNLAQAKDLADATALPHSWEASADVKKTEPHEGKRRTALIGGAVDTLASIVCSEFTSLTMVGTGVDLKQRYRDPKTGLPVAWFDPKRNRLVFADLYGVTANLWDHATAILAAQHGAGERVEPGSAQAEAVKSKESAPFLLVAAGSGAVDVKATDSFGAAATARSLGGIRVEPADRRPGDLQQSYATDDGTANGAGHSSQVWAVRGRGVAYLGTDASPTLRPAPGAAIPPGWYAVEDVFMELGPETDPATVASLDVTWVQLIDANTGRKDDATRVGAMQQASTYSPTGESTLVAAGRLPSSKWLDWQPTTPAVIGAITAAGVKPR